MRLLRVETYRGGRLVEGRTFPNHNVARVHAEAARSRGYRALVMYPRAEARA